MDSQDIAKIIYSHHIKKIRNLHHPNEKIFVLFSGVAGSGKSFLAKKIEERFKAVRINNDDIRDIIRDEIAPKVNMEEIKPQELLQGYLHFLYEKISKKNGMIILDSSMDRSFESVRMTAKQYGYKIFLIRIDLPRETLEKQIRQRTDKDPGPYIRDLDKQIGDHQRFSAEVPADFVISVSNFDKFDDLYQALQEKMDSRSGPPCREAGRE